MKHMQIEQTEISEIVEWMIGISLLVFFLVMALIYVSFVNSRDEVYMKNCYKNNACRQAVFERG